MESVPWFVGGGAQHSPEVARLLAYAGTGGNGGIVEPGGLKVAALSVPGTSVRVLPGAAVLVNQYPGGSQQSYLVRSAVQEEIAIPATGSSGGNRNDLIVARIVDPQYEGSAPANPDAFAYARIARIAGVSWANMSSVAAAQAYCRTLPYPCEPLAVLVIPPSTGTITQDMIRDLRQIATKRSHSEVLMGAATANAALTSTSATVWPHPGFQLEIPLWATHMSVVATLTGVGVRAQAANGLLWVRAGAAGQWGSGGAAYDVEVAVDNASDIDETTTLVVGGKAPLAAGMAGSTVLLRVEGTRAQTNGANAGLKARASGTQVLYQVTFTQETI